MANDDDEPNYRASDIKELIWREVIANPDVSLDELQHALRQGKKKMSAVTTGTLASDFRRILKFLIREGLINERRLQARQRTERQLSTQRENIIHAINRAERPLGPNAIAAATRMGSNNVRFLLHQMVKEGDLERLEHDKYWHKHAKRKRPFREWNFSG